MGKTVRSALSISLPGSTSEQWCLNFQGRCAAPLSWWHAIEKYLVEYRNENLYGNTCSRFAWKFVSQWNYILELLNLFWIEFNIHDYRHPYGRSNDFWTWIDQGIYWIDHELQKFAYLSDKDWCEHQKRDRWLLGISFSVSPLFGWTRILANRAIHLFHKKNNKVGPRYAIKFVKCSQEKFSWVCKLISFFRYLNNYKNLRDP